MAQEITLPVAENIGSNRADAALKKYSTALTTTLGLVICVTGVMMFFRLYKGEVAAMHEWLGMAFVAAIALHLLRHRRPFINLLAQPRTWVLSLLTALIAVAFLAFPSPKGGGNPMKQTVNAVLRAPIGQVAPVLGISEAELIDRLDAAGIPQATARQSIESLARSKQRNPMQVLTSVINPVVDKD